MGSEYGASRRHSGTSLIQHTALPQITPWPVGRVFAESEGIMMFIAGHFFKPTGHSGREAVGA